MFPQLTSFAACSKSSFLSAALKASSVLVLYSVPTAGQQWAGVGAFLDTTETWLTGTAGTQRAGNDKPAQQWETENSTLEEQIEDWLYISLEKYEYIA